MSNMHLALEQTRDVYIILDPLLLVKRIANFTDKWGLTMRLIFKEKWFSFYQRNSSSSIIIFTFYYKFLSYQTSLGNLAVWTIFWNRQHIHFITSSSYKSKISVQLTSSKLKTLEKWMNHIKNLPSLRNLIFH